MPSSYLLVHAVVPGGARVVLLGNKNIIGNRVHGAPVGQVVWNSAGQVVIPGGRRTGARIGGRVAPANSSRKRVSIFATRLSGPPMASRCGLRCRSSVPAVRTR